MNQGIKAFFDNPESAIPVLESLVHRRKEMNTVSLDPGEALHAHALEGVLAYVKKQLHPTKSLKIVGVAIRANNGLVYSMKAPARHVDLKRLMREDGYEGPTEGNERDGFLLSNGSFCRRVAAGALARRTGQLQSEDKKFVHGGHFTSEDLW